MPTFLVWNVQRKPLDALVLGLVDRHAVDAVVLIEHGFALTQLPEWLDRIGFREHVGNERFALFARSELGFNRLPGPVPHSRFDCWQVSGPSGTDGLLGIVHGHDVRNANADTRAVLFRRLATVIEFHENQFGHRRTVLTGDFNASPFAPEMIGAHGLHALGVREVRERFTRRTNEEDVAFFYNPMWRQYGYGPDAGAATHYYGGYGATEHLWHMFDQVVTRPDTADRLPEDRIRIARTIGPLSLLDPRGNPNERDASDHLPLLFFWDL